MNDRFCKDCKWASDEGSTVRHPNKLWACSNDKCGSRVDVVDGRRLLRDCHEARYGSSGQCGPEGKFWEAKS